MIVNGSRNILILISFYLFILGCTSSDASSTLLMFCAAGMKPAIQEITDQYYKEKGVKIDVQYAGSGTLLSNIRISKQGDLYLSADDSYIKEAKIYGLIKSQKAIAYIKPVIAVKKGNPKNIYSLEDLLRSDVDLVLANPDAASIGRQTETILNEYDDFTLFEEKVVAFMPTVNEVINTVKLGTSDAGIVWNANALQYEEIETVNDSFLNKYVHTITIGILEYSKHPKQAKKFINYLSSAGKGGKVMKKLGYEIIQ